LWAISFGSPGSDYSWFGNGVANENVESGGRLYVTGGIVGPTDFGPNVGVLGYPNIILNFIAQMDGETGSFLWVRVFEFQQNSFIEASVGLLPNGNVILSQPFGALENVGGGNLIAKGEEDSFMVCLDNKGNFVWNLTIGGDSASAVDVVESVTITPSGLILVGGVLGPNTDFGAGIVQANGETGFLAIYDSNGDFQFSKTYPVVAVNPLFGSAVLSIAVNPITNDVLFCGYFSTYLELGGNALYNIFSGLPNFPAGMFVAKFHLSESSSSPTTITTTTPATGQENPEGCPAGTLKCPCVNGQCDEGLTCGTVSKVCDSAVSSASTIFLNWMVLAIVATMCFKL